MRAAEGQREGEGGLNVLSEESFSETGSREWAGEGSRCRNRSNVLSRLGHLADCEATQTKHGWPKVNGAAVGSRCWKVFDVPVKPGWTCLPH